MHLWQKLGQKLRSALQLEPEAREVGGGDDDLTIITTIIDMYIYIQIYETL